MLPPREAERLSAADASNVVMDADDQVNVFLMAGILGVGGFVTTDGAPDRGALRGVIAARIGDHASTGLARFTQRVRVHGRTLTWQPCLPDLSWHVRRVDPVDGVDGLADLCASLMTVPMPLDRPLRELLIVSGASPDGPGIVLRVHDAVADGVAAVRLLQRLFGSTTTPPTTTPTPRAAIPPAPRWRWRTSAASITRVSAVFRATVAPTVLLGPISSRRGVAFAEVDLAALARAAKTQGPPSTMRCSPR